MDGVGTSSSFAWSGCLLVAEEDMCRTETALLEEDAMDVDAIMAVNDRDTAALLPLLLLLASAILMYAVRC